MNTYPVVSIIIPSLNQGRFLAESVESVLSQDYRMLEILVLDGGSCDETREILRRYDGTPGFWWRSEPDGGVVDAVNEGLTRARGGFCGIVSADDAYLPRAVDAAVSALAGDRDLMLVYADAEYVDADRRLLGRTRVGEYSLERLLARRTFIIQCSAFFRTEVARRLGGWRREVSYVADNDLWLRMALVGRVARVDGIWSRYRFHAAQRDKARERIVRDWNRAVTELMPRLPQRLHRAARVGCYLTAWRYAPTGSWAERARALCGAVAANPGCVLWPEFPRRDLLPPVRSTLASRLAWLRTVATRLRT